MSLEAWIARLDTSQIKKLDKLVGGVRAHIFTLEPFSAIILIDTDQGYALEVTPESQQEYNRILLETMKGL